MLMADVVIVGSVALDSIRTPFGEAKNVLGGSATYAGYACSFFAKPAVVAVVGKDFPKEHISLLKEREIDLEGLEIKEGKTFRWEGYYEFDLNQAHTIKTELNVLENFDPTLPEKYKDAEFLFLGNIDPTLQLNVLNQMNKKPKLVVADTMNYWIETKREKVLQLIKEVDIGLMNDSEARMLFDTTNLVSAAREILRLDSKIAIIKKGEHGSILFTDSSHFSAPGYPLENVKDPTGAGDCFAGAMIGYLAKTNDLSEANFRKAIIYASALASLNAEDFSLNNLKRISIEDIEGRYGEFKEIVKF